MVLSAFPHTVSVNVSGFTGSHMHVEVSSLLVQHFGEFLVVLFSLSGVLPKLLLTLKQLRLMSYNIR